MWNIQWSDEAVRDFSNLEKEIAARIIKKLEKAASDPLRYFEKQIGSDSHKLQIGDYRVLAVLSMSIKTIFIEKAGHRKNIYKR